MRSSRRATRRAVAAAVAFTSVFLLATCDLDKITGSKTEGPNSSTIDSTELTLSATGTTLGSLILGQNSTLSVTSSSVDLAGVAKRYYTADATKISIDSVTGLMTGKAIGTSKITAKILAPELGDGVTRSELFTVRYKNIRVQTPTATDSMTGLLQTRTVSVQGTNFGDTVQAGALVLDSIKSRDATIVSVSGTTLTARKGGTVKIDAFLGALRDSVSVRVRQVAKSITFPTTNYVARHMNFNVTVPLTVKDVSDSIIPTPTLTWRAAGANGTGSPDTTTVVVSQLGAIRVKKIDTTFFVFAKMDTVERGQRITVSQVVGSLTKFAGDLRQDTVGKNVTVLPTVTALDSGNTIVKGATVIFRPPVVGTITDTLQITDTLGRARPTAWKLADVVDTNRLTVTSGNASTLFRVAGIAGRPVKLSFSVQPASAAIGGVINSGTGIKVTVLDSLNNAVTGTVTSVTIAFSNNPSGATLGGTLTQSTVAGVATFNNISVNLGGTGYTLQATATGLGLAISNGFDAFGAATKLGFIQVPASGTVSVPVSPAVRVAVQDANGATVTTATNTITVAFTGPGGGTLSCSCTVAAVAGVATVTPTFNTSGSWSGTATATGLTAGTSSAFTVSAVGPAAELQFGVQPSNAVAGAAITPAITVRILDANGALVTTASSTITLSIDPGTNTNSGTLTGTTAFASGGVATFSSTSINRANTGYRLVATSGSLTTATSNAFNITTGNANKLGFVQQPTNTVAGQTMSPSVTVEVQDASGNRVTSSTASIALTLGGCTATLSGGSAQTSSAGLATFSALSIGTQVTSCTVTAASTGLASATSSSFASISATGPARLRFTTQPTTPGTATSTSQSGGTVQIQDPNGNNVSSSTSVSITLSVLSGPSTTITGTTTRSTTTNTSFTLLGFATAGTYRLLASAPGFRPDTSANLVINPGTATKLGYLVQPTTRDAGVPFSPTVAVAVQDANGNTVTTSGATITLANNSGGGFSTGNTVSVAAVSGVATFTGLTIKKTGTSFTLTATSSFLTSSSSNTISITPAPLSALGFSVQPSTVTAGSNFFSTVQVQAQDSVGNVVTDFTSPITVALTGGTAGAVLSGTKTVTASAGVSNFPGLTIDKSGTLYQLNASASGLTNAVSNNFTVNAGTATKLGWVVQPASQTYLNAPIGADGPTAQVTVQDALGNTVSTFSTVRIAVQTGPSATFKSFGSPTTFVDITASSGIASIPSPNMIMSTTGSYTLLASSPFSGYTASISTSMNVGAFGPKTKLGWNNHPGNGTYGVRLTSGGLTPNVFVQDAWDNLVTNATDNVTVAIGTDGNPPTTLTGGGSTAAAGGGASFPNLVLNRAGTGYTLTATATGLTSSTSNSFTTTSPGLVTTTGFFLNDMVRLGDTIYFTHSSALKKVHITGGTVTTITASTSPTRITTDGTNIYWAELNTNSGDALIKKLTVATGGVTTLTTGMTSLAQSGSKLFSDGTNVYFVARNQGATASAVKSISVNANNTAPTDLYSTGGLGNIPTILVSGGLIYFGDPGSPFVIKRMTTTGASVTTLASGLTGVYYQLSGTTLYFNDGLTVKSIANANSISGPVTPTTLFTAPSTVYDVEIDGSNFYIQTGANIRRYALSDFSTFTAVVTNADQFQHAFLFDTVDMYHNDTSGRIAKVPK